MVISSLGFLGPTFIPGKNGGTMEDDKTYRGDIDDLMNWADEEGGLLSLFCYKGVDLNEFDLTDRQLDDLRTIAGLFYEAMYLCNNLEMGFNE